MAGGDLVGADLPRGDEQLIEFDMVVAESARNRRAPAKIIGDKGTHDSFLERLLKIDNIKREAEVVCDAARVVNIVERAAAMRRRASGRELGQAALIPELHGQADDRLTGRVQESSNSGAVHTAAHGDGSQSGLSGGLHLIGITRIAEETGISAD